MSGVKNKIISGIAPTDLGERMIRFVISNESEDRDGDVLLANGCDFTNFSKNPQFLGFHNYCDYPLGVPKKWFVDQETKSVVCDVYFPTIEELTGNRPETASEKVKLVDAVYNMYKLGMLSAVSVGFRAIKWEKNERSSSEYGRTYVKWELLEFSAVPVPSNQDALAQACKSYDPTGKVLEMFEDAEKDLEEKSGARLSLKTLESLEKILACNDRIEKEMVLIRGYITDLKGKSDDMVEDEDDSEAEKSYSETALEDDGEADEDYLYLVD